MFRVDDDGVIHVPFLRTAYNYDMNKASDETGLDCSTMPSKVQQQFKDDADINTIVKRFGLTGELPKDLAVPQSGDFTDVVDFHSAMNIVRASEEAFMEMPADVRKRFHHDPGEFLAFVNDDKNRDEAKKLGIMKPDVVVPKVEPLAVRVVPDVSPAGPVST